MPTTPKSLLFPVLLLLVSFCLFVSYLVLYASPGSLATIITHHVDPDPAAAAAAVAIPTLPHLRALCARTQWHANLAIHCHSRCGRTQTSFCGGINNARDRLQSCLRLAVDAGATTVVLPSLAARSEDRIATINPAAVQGAENQAIELCADAWFDLQALRDALAQNCPQTRLASVCSPGDTPARLAGASQVVAVPWRDSGDAKYDVRPGHTLNEAVQDALLLHANASSASHHDDDTVASGTETTTLVEVGDTYTAWDYYRADEHATLFKDLFQAVTFNATLRALGQRLVAQLGDEPYMGVHLRGENDWPAEWGSLAVQTRLYADDMQALGRRDQARGRTAVTRVYVSCGNRTAIQSFRDRLEPMGYTVLDKWSLLEAAHGGGGDDDDESLLLLAQTIAQLSFDEKAVVEYEPLVRARYFWGISFSSMSFVVATTRTLGEPGDFLETWVLAAGDEDKGIHEVRGNDHTRLIFVNIE